ncbi:amidase family protein [Pseudaquabacterium pictum]|uniref:Amidase n=1 Tax=Pseudaquabacterium pictum TaxID=2315236 RepID=A0A480AMQ6_9BURK|nr:amidase [Rubrivivax pictus]GCL61312.1 amidase [Rubrivivax pictus]
MTVLRPVGPALAAIDAQDAEVRAWAVVDRVGARIPPAPGPISGWTLGVKDVLDVAGLPTRAGSPTRAEVAPATADAPAVALLRAAGAVVLGKTVTTEFATMDPAATANPAAPGHTPGGSSSGSAAAVAAGMADLAIGTQTAGSLCRPAAYCGVAAFKPTRGRVPTTGMVPLAPSFDTIGLMAGDVARLAVALRCWGIPDAAAPTAPVIGVPMPDCHPDLDAAGAWAIAQVSARLRTMGARIVPVRLPFETPHVVALHRRVMAAEAFAAHGRLEADGRVGPRFRELLGEGAVLGAAEVTDARSLLQELGHSCWAGFADLHGLLLPPAPGPAPAGLGATGPAHYQIPWTAFGGPLAALPCGQTRDRLPLGTMLAARPGDDASLVSLALALERALGVGDA